LLNILRVITNSNRMKWAEMQENKVKMKNAHKIVAAKI
jgi:hypothetical protein